MTAGEMLDALTPEQAQIVHAFAIARVNARTDPNALEVFGELVGDQTLGWVMDFAYAWHQRWLAERPARADLDVEGLLQTMPPSLRTWAAARLANPVFDDANEAKESLMMNLRILRRQAERSR